MEAGTQPKAQVALVWTLGRPGVASLLIDGSWPEQLNENVAALDLELHPHHRQAQDVATEPEPYPCVFGRKINRMVFGATFGPSPVRNASRLTCPEPLHPK